MLKIKVVGCGTAVSDDLFNTSFYLTSDSGKTMLFDCGYNIPRALKHHQLPLPDAIYISHLHADHVGGLERMAFGTYDWARRPLRGFDGQIKLCGNEQLLKDLWEKSLRGGMESMEGFQATLDTYFAVCSIKPNDSFMFDDNICTPIQQVHIMSGNIIVPSFGLMIETTQHRKVYFVGDSQFDSPKQSKIYYNQADIIFQDCECFVDPATKKLFFSSGVHASYGELAGWESANCTQLSAEIKSKMLLCHYQDFVANETTFDGTRCDWMQTAADDGFDGFVRLGKEYVI